ncbi:MAG TPA: glycosyltransferase family 4 protein [Candidatus Thermoplasmatota archaeon]|nr:glycosyltransferase family 4 protein [Candidatus Thermoplasmatota archaeon]
MDILMTVHRFWPSIGGTEAFVEGLARTLAKRGHDVTIATSSEPGAPAEQTRDGYAIHRFELVRKGKFRVPHKDYRDLLRAPGWDVLVAHGQRVWSTDYAYDILRRTPTPVVLMYHGFYQHHMNRFRPPEWLYYRALVPWASKKRHLVAETEGEREELARWGVPRERIEVISSSLDASEFRAPHPGFRAKYGFAADEAVLLYVGGFYANKRVEDAVRIAAATRTPLVVIGRDPDPAQRTLAACRALAAREGADARFLGKIPWEDVLSAYQECTLFLLPARFEGYGLVLLEAMASGLPFVATRAGAAPELAAMGCGVSVPTWQDMAREAAALLQDPARRASMGAIGRERALGFTWEHVAAAHERLYRRAIREQLSARR